VLNELHFDRFDFSHHPSQVHQAQLLNSDEELRHISSQDELDSRSSLVLWVTGPLPGRVNTVL
jgi:hypothetical protein